MTVDIGDKVCHGICNITNEKVLEKSAVGVCGDFGFEEHEKIDEKGNERDD
eukprot:CAMPEP_0114594088 /NCGR_PEP_ID=MMETSP0125-20121206/15708_1 /TAXON_ID=485358 ORGANISM="Aristerostoma sp., Strain ATCC 50986" /NCGR_SAMPLE_ID=MMETSP0125 /ASSEMBLY_ACC=CAM_ASM_000245 /LENGTH=50 /DNA_ID=CAMNT_0001793969 /DNA_START=841 /DNA_END=993 /DNA_ORIENTATION=-